MSPGKSTDAIGQSVDEAGYPRDTLDSLLDRAEREFAEHVGEHGPGKNWAGSEPRWDLVKAVDELFSARDHAQAGRYDKAEEHAANGLNHLLFSLENTDA